MSNNNKTLQTYILWLIDMMCIIVSYVIATFIRFSGEKRIELLDEDKMAHYMVCIVFLLFCVVYNFFADWNRDFCIRGFAKEFLSVVRFIGVMIIASVFVVFLFKWNNLSRLVWFYFVLLDVLLTYFARIAFKVFFRKAISSDSNAVRVVVVAERNLMESTIKKLTSNAEFLGYKIVRAYAADTEPESTDADGLHAQGGNRQTTGEWYIDGVHIHEGIENLTARLLTDPFDEVFINTPNIPQNNIQDIILGFEEMGITTRYSLGLPGVGKATTQFEDFMDYSVITYSMNRTSYKRLFIKRSFDIVFGFIGVLVTGIITLFLAPAIKLDSPGPVFFSQTRIGKNGRRFKIYKFRSMYIDAEERKKELESQNEMKGLMFKMENDPRITKVGAFIRKTSLDEFPQFLNILKGDMSLVGTRPPTVEEFRRYNGYYRRRLSMTPGLTGLWQISGRSDIEDFDEVVKLDLKYIDNWSLTEDFMIIAKTFYVVFFGKGAK
ncbi:sugar transferase [Butyrivibrio sp. XB500-5]|uniref:sugar transferase n=1 Tax=Butyrivibrio sp. XB500-5 TaxID=2364880 RepID=UPI000EAA2E9E|nr:sugar transferase [Butyrivibrio sp. XB500-5]RKM63404.1 sugar transferase [Butyrivibrio sp. XB500-5]